MNILKIDHHFMYLAVLLTFTSCNYLSTGDCSVHNIGKMLANVEVSSRSDYVDLLRSIDTEYEKTYSIEVNGEVLNLRKPMVTESFCIEDGYGVVPLPCQQTLLNELSDNLKLEKYVLNYKSVMGNWNL